MKFFDRILETLDIAAQIASGIGVGGTIPGFADYLLKIVIAANKAHVAATGQPIDFTKIPKEELVP